MFQRKFSSPHPLALVPQGTRLDIVSVEGSRDGRPRVTRCESYPLADGLASALARLRQGGKLSGACTTLLGAGEYQFLAIEAPPLPESAPQAELREAVRWKIKDTVDFPVTAAGVDVLRLPPQPGRAAQLLAAAASHAVLKPLIETWQDAKAALAEITVPEIAQRNVARLFETPDRALALLTFGAQGGLLTLSCNGTLYAARRIDVSAADLARDKSLYERVVLDVQRSLDNFDRNFSQLSLQRLLVLPVPAADDFVAHLRDNLYQPVEALEISDGLDIAATPMLANAATLADALPAIGVALGSTQTNPGINLFDPALLRQRDPWTARNLGLGLAASALICAVGGGWAHWRQAEAAHALLAVDPRLQAARAEAKQLADQIARHKPDVALQRELEANRQRLQARNDVLAFLQKGMSPATGEPGEWLRGFARQIPNGLWLTGFNVNIDSGALEIRGRTLDPRLIGEYVRRLNAEQAFQGRTFAALEISGPAAQTATAPAPAGAPATGIPATPASAQATAQAPAAGPARYHEFSLTSAPADRTAAAGSRS